MTWVEEDAKAIKMMVENKQNLVNVTLANASSLLCNSGHPPVTSTPARCTSIVPPAEAHSSVDTSTTLAKQEAGTSHRQSSQPQRLSVSDITTSTTCRDIDSQSLVSDFALVLALVIHHFHQLQIHPSKIVPRQSTAVVPPLSLHSQIYCFSACHCRLTCRLCGMLRTG